MIGGHRETLSAGRGCENQALIQQTSIWTENACMLGYENRTIVDLKTENEYKTAALWCPGSRLNIECQKLELA